MKSIEPIVRQGSTSQANAAAAAHAFDAPGALDALETGVACVDAAWRVVYVNRAWRKVMSASGTDVTGLDFWKAFPAFASAPESALMRATLTDGEPRNFAMTYDDVGREGGYDVHVVRTANGGGILALRDNRKRVEAGERARENDELRRRAEGLLEEAQCASQAKSVFLATISHELRTPLTALTGYGELLADEIVGPLSKSQHEVVERMRSVTHHLTAMIDELLAYTRLEGGREQVHAMQVSGDDLLRTTHAVVAPLARAKGIECDLQIPLLSPTLNTDAEKVRQILVNLAGNAVKFTDEGAVMLSLVCDDHFARFAVRDTGVGISSEQQRRLFQPFTQLDSGLTRRHGGTGLGLYISLKLANLLGGQIDCESVPGAGSTFTLSLPRTAA